MNITNPVRYVIRTEEGEGEPSLAEMLGQTMGFISMCWSPRPEGEFLGETASAALQQLADNIMELKARWEGKAIEAFKQALPNQREDGRLEYAGHVWTAQATVDALLAAEREEGRVAGVRQDARRWTGRNPREGAPQGAAWVVKDVDRELAHYYTDQAEAELIHSRIANSVLDQIN